MHNFYFTIFINTCTLKNIGKILKCVRYMKAMNMLFKDINTDLHISTPLILRKECRMGFPDVLFNS